MKSLVTCLAFALIVNLSHADISLDDLQGSWWYPGGYMIIESSRATVYYVGPITLTHAYSTDISLEDKTDGQTILRFHAWEDIPEYTFILRVVSEDELSATRPVTEHQVPLRLPSSNFELIRNPSTATAQDYVGRWSAGPGSLYEESITLTEEGSGVYQSAWPGSWSLQDDQTASFQRWWPPSEGDAPPPMVLRRTPWPEAMLIEIGDRLIIAERKEESWFSHADIKQMESQWRTMEQNPIAMAGRIGLSTRRTVKVVNDDGQPVAGANVQVSFMMWQRDWIEGVTDEQGLFTAEGRSKGEWRTTIEKDGYDATHIHYKPDGQDYERMKAGEWSEWAPVTTAILRRVTSPLSK